MFERFQKHFDPENLYCNVGVAIVGSAVVGAASTAYGASKASSAQQHAVDSANALQREQYERTRADLAPYRDLGTKYSTELDQQMPFLTSPIEMSQEELEKTPGYQFNLKQGTKAVQNSAAKRGLGVSGAALKGATTFATGLADSTYQNQFNNENTNRTNAYNRLKGMVDTGAAAAAGTAAVGTSTTNAINANTIGGGNAAAAAANTIGSAGSKLASDVGGYYAFKGLYGSNPVDVGSTATA